MQDATGKARQVNAIRSWLLPDQVDQVLTLR